VVHFLTEIRIFAPLSQSLTTTMKKLILFLSLAFVIPASAQMSISYEEFALGLSLSTSLKAKSYTSTTDLVGVENLIATSGANKTWDFSGRIYTQNDPGNTQAAYVDVSSAPLHTDPKLAGATHCLKSWETGSVEAYYLYTKLTSSGYFTIGSVTDSAGTSMIVQAFDPPMQTYGFPLTMGTTWTSTSNMTSGFDIPGLTVTHKVESSCDGFGTLSTPSRAYKGEPSPLASNECLRVRTTLTQSQMFGSFGITTVTHSYQWITKGTAGGTVVSDTNDVPMSIGYSEGASTGVNNSVFDDQLTIRLSSNPASVSSTLSYNLPESGDVKVSMMDNLGREVKMLQNGFSPAGPNVIPIDPSTMANGTYLIRVSSNSFTATRKLIIAK
jgi:hypothetical protein